ncbi:MAG: ABC transporter permease [Bacteroidota bacterium]
MFSIILGSMWHNVRRRLFRVALTILQIAVGVACVVSVLSFNMHVSAAVEHGARSLEDIVIASGGSETRTGLSYSRVVYPIFCDEDVAQLAADAAVVEAVSPFARHWQPVTIEAAGTRYLVSGGASVGPDYARVVGLEMVEGGFIAEPDVRQKARVLAVSEDLARIIFGPPPYVGKTITCLPRGGLSQGPEGGFSGSAAQYRIIGVFKARQTGVGTFAGLTTLTEVQPLLWPTTANPPTFTSPFHNASGKGTYPYESLIVKTRPGKAQTVKERISSLVTGRRVPVEGRLGGPSIGGQASVIFESSKELAQGLARERSVLTLLLGGAVFIALVVSAIGILSIMMVTVVERTREIGLRRALGASRRAIVLQFTSDSAALSLAGGILGALAALLVYPFLNSAMFGKSSFTMGALVKPYPAPLAIVAGLALACLSGAVFGFVPALQAARVEAAETLREL